LTVGSAMCRAAAISAFDRPRATSRRIARSRSLKSASRESWTGSPGSVLATCSSSRRVAVALDQEPRRLDAVEPRHADVHQDDVGGGDRETVERLASVLCLADHRHVGLGVDHHPQTGAHECLVVDQKHAGHARSSATSAAGTGTRARTS
jgi:hypothetical protein